MSLKSVLSQYYYEPKLMKEHSLNIDANTKRKPLPDDDDSNDYDLIQLRLFNN